MSARVLGVQVEHLELEARIGGYEAAAVVADRVEATYSSVGRLVGSGPEHIALVDNATTAWMAAFHSVPFEPGDRVLTSEAEYGANFVAYLQAQRRRGIQVEVIPSDAAGQIDVGALADSIDERTRLVSISHIPTNGGLINPAVEVGEVASAAGVLYLLDACQSVGQLALDVDELRCDFLSGTGRKYVRAPRGTGFLYASQRVLDEIEPAILDHHGADWVTPDSYRVRDSARRFENWEFSYANVLGLGMAADEALGWGLDAIEARVVGLAEGLRDRLRGLGATVHDLGVRRCGIVTATVPGRTAAEVKETLAAAGVNVSVAVPHSTWIDAARRGLEEMVRLSVHYFNTDEELDRTVAVLSTLVR